MKYIIEPYNEGQELNYIEIKDFKTKKEAKRYASQMEQLLQIALSEGNIKVHCDQLKEHV